MLRAASREYQPLALPVAIPATRAIGWPATTSAIGEGQAHWRLQMLLNPNFASWAFCSLDGDAMKKRLALLGACAVAITFVAGGVRADSIKPIEGKSVDLGTFGVSPSTLQSRMVIAWWLRWRA